MKISGISLLVDDQDLAKSFFVEKLGFIVKEDITDKQTGHRWLVVSPTHTNNVDIILTLAPTQQKPLIGKQGGEGVLLILQTQNFDESYQQMLAKGIEFCESPRMEPYGKVAIFKDLCGNKWDLIERY
ncbi:MAG: VOC family protein [Aliiglaciecola sp.]